MLTLYISTNNENTKHVPRVSGINSIIAYYLISKSLKVYGWNNYHNKKLSSMNLLEFIVKIFFHLKILFLKTVESSLTHLFFANYFKNIKTSRLMGILITLKINFSINYLHQNSTNFLK